MPTYGYECTACDNQFEVFQSIKDDPLTACETCGGTLRKRIYPVGIAFKGSGFYVNDYAPKSPASADKGGEGKSETKSEAKAETTTETKPESPKTETPKADKTPTAAV